VKISLIDFLKNAKTSNLMKIRLLGAEFHPEGQTDWETWRSRIYGQ